MSEETKRIVAERTWTAEDFSSLAGPHDQGHPVAVAMAQVAACAPEALRLLVQAEFVFGPGGNRACPWCQKVITPADLHTDSCAWLALMKKAGLR